MTEAEQTDARQAIRHLQSLYNTSGDRGRIDALIETFAIDGVLEAGGESHAGQASIHAFLTGVVTGGGGTIDLHGSRHHLTTTRIDVETADTAQGWAYFFVMRRGRVLQEGVYIDRYARTNEGWRIAHRRVKILWEDDASINRGTPQGPET